MSETKSILKDKSSAFAIEIVKTYKVLVEEKKEYVMSKQLLRSGTSVGANIREAKNAESTNDFIHKLGISQKECDETLYWLELLKETEYLGHESFSRLSDQSNLKNDSKYHLNHQTKKSQTQNLITHISYLITHISYLITHIS